MVSPDNGTRFGTTLLVSRVQASGPTFTADFDNDGDVDGDDLTEWRNDFGPTAGSDADGDGDSDGADFLVWQQQLGSGPAVPVAGAVPEPKGQAILLAAALAAWLHRPRRREARS
jgi:hypothetical protein